MKEKNEKVREKEVPEKKKKEVEELADLIKKNNSIVIVSIKNLPTSQFQLIKKKLKDKAIIRVVKKNIINRAIDKIEKGTIKNFKKYLDESQALIFSKLTPFELSAILAKNKTKARAKAGQVVEEDIVIESGPTELTPGPVISELGGLGIKFVIKDGKIEIKERKVIIKTGEQVGEEAASIMSKLDMKPISVGLEPIVAYDSEEDKIYEDIKVDEEKAVEELRSAAGKALALAVKIGYVCKETISFILRKASGEEKKLEQIVKKAVGWKDKDKGKSEKESKEEKKPEEETDKKLKKDKENTQQTKQENKSEQEEK